MWNWEFHLLWRTISFQMFILETDNTFIKRHLNYYISSVILVFVIGMTKDIHISHINCFSNLSFFEIFIFFMVFSAQKLNKQGNNIKLWLVPFPILNQFIVPCPILTAEPLVAYTFSRRHIRYSRILISKNFTKLCFFLFIIIFLFVCNLKCPSH